MTGDKENEDKYLETNDDNWYKLCRKKIGYKQTDINDYTNKDNKIEQIRFNI